jgi:hypothetical protein
MWTPIELVMKLYQNMTRHMPFLHNKQHVDNDDDILWRVPLSPAERYQLRHMNNPTYEGNNNIVSVMEFKVLTPKFDYSVFLYNLRSVLNAVQMRHPLLQCGIVYDKMTVDGKYDVQDRHGWNFVRRREIQCIPIHEVSLSWSDACIVEMNTSFSFDGPFMRVTVCKDGSGTNGTNSFFVLFCFHHVASDAGSGARIVQDLTGILDLMDHTDIQLEQNQEIYKELSSTPTRPIPQTLAEQIPKEFVKSHAGLLWFFTKTVAKVVYKCGMSPSSGFPLVNPLPPKRFSDFILLEFTKEATQSLVQQCQTHQVSMTSLLHAALVYNCVRLIHADYSPSKIINIPVPVTTDLRKIPCPIPSTAEDMRFLSSCYISFLDVRNDPNLDIWELAARSKEELQQVITRPDIPIDYYQALSITSKFPQEDISNFPLLFGNLGVVEILKGKQLQAIVKHCAYSTQGTTNQIYASTFTTEGKLSISLSFNSALKLPVVQQYARNLSDYLNQIAYHATSSS